MNCKDGWELYSFDTGVFFVLKEFEHGLLRHCGSQPFILVGVSNK